MSAEAFSLLAAEALSLLALQMDAAGIIGIMNLIIELNDNWG